MARTRRRNGYVEKLNTKTGKWERSGKPQPAKPAVKTNPVTRTGPVKGPVPPKGNSAVKLPNSAKAGVNLPKVGAGVERGATQGPTLKGTKPAPRVAPKVTASGVAGGAGRFLGAAGTAIAIPAAIKNIKDVAERNKRWEEYKERMGMNQKPNSTNRTGQGTTAGTRGVDKPPAKPHARRGQGSTDGRTTPSAKPQPKPENRGNTNTDPAYARTRQAQLDAERERLKGVGNPTAKPAAKPNPPKPSGSGSNPPTPTRGSGSTSSASKPTPKPAGKVPSSNAGMKNQDKNFRGNPDRKDSIASTLRELRGMGSGRKTNEANASKPEDKSRYVASNGKPYAGPAFGDSKSSTAKKEDKKMTLAERMRKRRQGLA